MNLTADDVTIARLWTNLFEVMFKTGITANMIKKYFFSNVDFLEYLNSNGLKLKEFKKVEYEGITTEKFKELKGKNNSIEVYLVTTLEKDK